MRVWDTSQQAILTASRRARTGKITEKGTLFPCLLFSFIFGKDGKGMERKIKDGHIVVENPLFQELPTHEVTIKSGRTLYRFTGSYDGERSLPHKVLKFTVCPWYSGRSKMSAMYWRWHMGAGAGTSEEQTPPDEDRQDKYVFRHCALCWLRRKAVLLHKQELWSKARPFRLLHVKAQRERDLLYSFYPRHCLGTGHTRSHEIDDCLCR